MPSPLPISPACCRGPGTGTLRFHQVDSAAAPDRPLRALGRSGGPRGRLTRDSGQSAALSAPPWTWPRALGPWAAPSARSEAATPWALGPLNPSAHSGDNASDLHREVIPARRREDLGEAGRQAPDRVQPDVTPRPLAPPLCLPRIRGCGGGHGAEALAPGGKFGRPAVGIGPAGPPPPSSPCTGTETERDRDRDSPPSALSPSGGGEVKSGGGGVGSPLA